MEKSIYKDISVNDMHILNAIGIEGKKKYVSYRQTDWRDCRDIDDRYQQSCEKRLCIPFPQ